MVDHQLRRAETAQEQPLSRSRRTVAMITLCLSVVLVSMDNMIVNVSLPTMSRELAASTKDLQWIVDGYTVAFASLLLIGGYLGDRFGHRVLLAIGLIGFIGASLSATQLTSVNALVATRAAMGLSAALLYPCTLALLTSIFPGPELPMAIGIWSGVSGAGIALGPILGGLLLKHFSWTSIFWVNVPVATVALVAGLVFLRGTGHNRRVGRFDVIGSVLSVSSIATLTYSVIEAPTKGWQSRATMTGFVISAVVIVAFILWEAHVNDPLLNVRMLARPAISAAAGCVSIAHFALFGFIFVITMYFQLVKGWGTLQSGAATLPYAVTMAALSPVAMLVARRLGNRTVVAGGMLMMATGLVIATTADVGTKYLPLVVASMVVMAAGMGLAVGPATALLMDAMPEGFAGVGSGINDTTREVGGALGVAVVGSVLNTYYRRGINVDFTALRVPAAATKTAEDSLGSALSVTKHLPRAVAQQAHDAALHAYVHAMHSGTWIAVGAALLSSIMALFSLGRRHHDELI